MADVAPENGLPVLPSGNRTLVIGKLAFTAETCITFTSDTPLLGVNDFHKSKSDNGLSIFNNGHSVRLFN
jgi:hypothetical protein